jgi:hypothetical protein
VEFVVLTMKTLRSRLGMEMEFPRHVTGWMKISKWKNGAEASVLMES